MWLRLLRHGLPADFDRPIEVRDPERAKSSGAAAAEDLFDMMVRIFPFVLVMWSLAGALYPAHWIGRRDPESIETLFEDTAGDKYQTWEFAQVEGADDERVEHAEDRGVRADPQGERQDGGGRKTGAFGEHARAETQILEHLILQPPRL